MSQEFCSANNFRNQKQFENAIRCYKDVIAQEKTSSQEKYISCFYLHQCLESIGNKEGGFFYLVKSMKYDLERVECLNELAVYYCCDNMSYLAYEYYKIIEPHFLKASNDSSITNSKLHFDSNISNFFFPYIMIIVADRVNERACGVSMYEIIFQKKQRVFSLLHLNNLFFNLRFFISHASSQFISSANEYLSFLEDNGINLIQFEKVANSFDYCSYGIDLLMKTKTKQNVSMVSMTESRIPKCMMQTWGHKQLSPQFKEIVDTWKKYNPEYQFALLDDNDSEEFIQKHFEQDVINAYKRIIPGAYKADLFRCCYLWVNGGVYADIDTLCMGKLDDFLIPGADLVVPVDLNYGPNEGTHNLFNTFIAAVPRHPVMMICIQKIVYNVKNNIVPSSKLDFSGPGVLGRSVNEFLNRNETDSFVGTVGLHHANNISGGIHFLKFEPITEFVKNANNQVLFQNKNGNHEIARLYHDECCKLNKFVCWVNCASPIAEIQVNHPKICFITAVYGNYEASCKRFEKQTVPTDFICFTDNQNMVGNGWIIDTTPYHLTHKSKLDNSTFVNSMSNNKHTFNIAKYYKQSFSNVPRLKKYDVIVWLDGTIEITHNKTSEYVLSKIYKEKIIGWHHEFRNGMLQGEVVGSNFCRYTSTFWNNQHQPYQDINKQYNDYIQDGYTDDFFKQIHPDRKHFGVWITCFVAFLQHEPAVQNFLELWYLQTLKYTTQDQIGFPYVCQKTKLIPYTLPDNEIHGTPHSHTMFYIKHVHGK